MVVVVIGNCTLDLTFRVARFPRPGETLLATAKATDIGGKGANQAVVVARAGVEVAFLAAIGRDAEGTAIRERLLSEGIDLVHLLSCTAPTDQSIIYVTPDGENSIVSSHDAAASIGPQQADALLKRLRPGDILLMQGNLSLTTTLHCLREARRLGAITVLNPAPINYAYDQLWPFVDVAIVNEVEAVELGGAPEPLTAGGALLGRGVRQVVVTLGAQGAVVMAEDARAAMPAGRVAAVDTAGAGDVFCGVFVAGLARGLAPELAIRPAVAAATLSVTRPGTQSSFPSTQELCRIFADESRTGSLS
jgi:ribokinase